jgi:aromatic ring-opening dioxygenase LigB subunit
MVLERLYVIPHGDEIIDRPNKNSRKMNIIISEMVTGDSSESIALISPHSLMLPERVAIVDTENASGKYNIRSRRLNVKCEIDRPLSRRLKTLAGDLADLVGFVTSCGKMSNFPLDFGSIIPLTFFKQRRIVLMGQPRPKNVDRLFAFGKVLFDWSINADSKISIVISADQAHTHAIDGPYGYSDESTVYDSAIISAIERCDFSRIRTFGQDFLGKAKPDSFWNMIVLAGFLEASKLEMKVNYYYVEHYFGMLAAGLKHL